MFVLQTIAKEKTQQNKCHRKGNPCTFIYVPIYVLFTLSFPEIEREI